MPKDGRCEKDRHESTEQNSHKGYRSRDLKHDIIHIIGGNVMYGAACFAGISFIVTQSKVEHSNLGYFLKGGVNVDGYFNSHKASALSCHVG
jgi:hypothetical protein